MLWLIPEEIRDCGSVLIHLVVNPDKMIVAKIDAFIPATEGSPFWDDRRKSFVGRLKESFVGRPAEVPLGVRLKESFVGRPAEVPLRNDRRKSFEDANYICRRQRGVVPLFTGNHSSDKLMDIMLSPHFIINTQPSPTAQSSSGPLLPVVILKWDGIQNRMNGSADCGASPTEDGKDLLWIAGRPSRKTCPYKPEWYRHNYP